MTPNLTTHASSRQATVRLVGGGGGGEEERRMRLITRDNHKNNACLGK